jgi:hypothetical protein
VAQKTALSGKVVVTNRSAGGHRRQRPQAPPRVPRHPGSHDVVPHHDLKNKLHDPGDPESDPDRFVGSDLPYACERGYS